MPVLNFNLYNILIATGIAHGFLFCTFVLAKKKYRTKLHIFLAFTLAALAFSNMQYWFRDTLLNEKWPFLTVIYIQIELLIGPLFYLFVNSYLQKKVSTKEIVLLLSPFIIATALQLYYSFNGVDGNIPSIVNIVLEYTTIFINLTVAILIFYNIYSYEKSHKTYSIKNVTINTKWLKTTLIFAIALCILWAAGTNVLRGLSTYQYGHYYPLWLAITVIIYWMAYAGVFYSNIFKEQKAIRKSYVSEDAIVAEIPIPEVKLENSQIPKKKLNDDLFNQIERLIEKQKLYTNPKVSLELVANKVAISPNYLSQLINNHSDQSFTHFINSKRVTLAKEFLVNPDFDKYTIQSVALETGFHSKSSFYTAFKKITNQTPTQYKSAQNAVLIH